VVGRRPCGVEISWEGARGMTPKQFVACFAREKDELVRLYMDGRDAEGAALVAALELPPAKAAKCRAILDSLLTDAFYTVLLALDGAASLGGKQEAYSVRDEKGHELAGGELEGHAWERFHGAAARPGRARRKRKRT
jgi:hypothetical protein